MTRSKKVIVLASIYLISLFAVFGVSKFHFEHQFRVLYSLDQKQNDQAIIDLINSAKKYVYFAVYTFTKDNIADALVSAKQRGVDVVGITDLAQSQEDFEKPIILKLTDAGILVETQTHADGIMHIKAVVTDQAFASGSFNWTSSATVANDEILEISTNKYLHDQYLEIIKKVLAANKQAQPTTAATATAIETIDTNTNATSAVYDYTQAGSHIGETAAVIGRVVQVYTSKSGTTFFDYCENYKSCGFSAVVFSSDKNKFSNLSQYQGQVITIKGKISSYQGVAEIILSSPDQIVK